MLSTRRQRHPERTKTMDSSRFDALTKTLVSSASRRRTLGGLLAGALATVGLSDRDDAWAAKNSGKCKKDCGPCKKCHKGDCHVKDNGKRKCDKGKCKPRPVGSPCTNPDTNTTGTCQSDKRCCRLQNEICTDACPGPGPTTSCTACCSGTCDILSGKCAVPL